MATPEQQFAVWLKQCAPWCKHFTAAEITRFARNSRGAVRNGMPPEIIWPNILPTLFVLEQLRRKLGKGITITSAYRSLPYNRALKSPDNSQHVSFRALDFVVSGASPAVVKAALLGWRIDGAWTGGLGTYPGFTHIDTRPDNATW